MTARAWAVAAGGMLICFAIYAPGLRGAFVFDDSTFVIANTMMHVTTLDLSDWAAAALSFPAGHQGRWLGMLSFAANHYFTGLDPFWLKLTNLGIHLANGLLVFAMLRALFALGAEYHRKNGQRPTFDAPLAAATLAVLWLVLPINLTGVLYVSQRLESLSNTFVFFGLWWYLAARREYARGQKGTRGLWLSLVVGTTLGSLVKESAVLLPLYALCIEIAITRGRGPDGRLSRPLVALYTLLIGVPFLLGTVWLFSWIGSASSYARPFGTFDRLLTEARVLVDYIHWTLIPQPESLTLYHDDVVVSHGLLDPPSTLMSIIGLATLVGIALWQRVRSPLFSLGVLWFFSGHLLTGTVIPLMLAFEHRNYFPSTGLLLAGASLVALEHGLSRARVRVALAACLFAFYAFTTWMRAEEWSDPLRLALSEANKRPDSSAAQYELARVLLYSRRAGEAEPMTKQAFEVLERASHIPNSDILHEQLLIVGHAQLNEPVDPAWWASLIDKLRQRPPTTADIAGLMDLASCYRNRVCAGDLGNLRTAFEAAVGHAGTDGVLLSAYGQFIEDHLNDPALAEQQFRAALAVAPQETTTHTNLIVFLIHHGRFDEARREIDSLRKLSHFGSLDATLAKLEAMLRHSEAGAVGEASSPAAFHADDARPSPS